jgi:hypothetical protein
MPYIIYGEGKTVAGLFEDPVDGAVWAPDAPASPLDIVVSESLRGIDRAAEAARGAYLTQGSGQSLAYQAKATEAVACLAMVSGGYPLAPEDYPHLSAEVGITADTLVGVAEVVSAQASDWALASAAIEATRLTAKAGVRAAATAAEIDAILAALSWPSP